jgi:hypothetical protein
MHRHGRVVTLRGLPGSPMAPGGCSAVLGRLRVERRANGRASSVMQRVPRGPVSSLAARQIKLGLEPASEAVELAVSWPTVM